MSLDVLSISLADHQEVENVISTSTDFPSFITGIFFGFMIVMALYNLLLYFSLQDKAYLFYVGTVVFNVLTVMAIHGISSELFWPCQPELDRSIYITFAGISMFFSSRFAALYLNLNEQHKKLDYFMWSLAILSLLLSMSSLTLSEAFVIPFGRWLVLLSFPSYLFVAFFALRKGFKPALYYIIAWIPYVLGLVIRTMQGAEWLPNTDLVLSSLEIGGALEIVLLSLALAYRIKEMQEENEQMRSQVQQYISQVMSLEEKIQSSTANANELHEQKLEKIAKQHELTDRETDVLMYLTKGLNNKQIADELFISVNTLKYHTRNIYEKMDIKRRAEITSKLLLDN